MNFQYRSLSSFRGAALSMRAVPFLLAHLEGTHEMSVCARSCIVEATLEMLDSGISEEALPMGLAPLFDPDPFAENGGLTWSLR
jgi:hypothetical protein